MMEQTTVRTKLTMKPVLLSVLIPLLVFFNSEAFFFSAEVREMAPMSSSVEKSATRTCLMILYHAVFGVGTRARQEMVT